MNKDIASKIYNTANDDLVDVSYSLQQVAVALKATYYYMDNNDLEECKLDAFAMLDAIETLAKITDEKLTAAICKLSGIAKEMRVENADT